MNRQMFESEIPDSIEMENTDIVVEFSRPKTWWQHAKLGIGLLRWLMRKGILGQAQMETVTKMGNATTKVIHKHYDAVAIVLDDKTEIPETMRHLEMKYDTLGRYGS